MGEEKHNGGPESVSKTLYELTQHVWLITVSFLLIFGAAILLDQLIEFLKKQQVLHEQTALLYALYGAKYTILMADLALLGVLTFKYTKRAIQSF